MSNRWFRRQVLSRHLIAVGLGASLLAACGSSGGSSSGATNTAEALAGTPGKPVTLPVYDDNKPIADGLEPEKGPLKLFNYADYISEDVISAFEDKYGVDVQVTTFDTDDEAVEKLRAGQVKTDLFLSASTNNLPKLVAGKLIQPLNRSYVPNFANVLPEFQDPFYDKGSQYTVPYTVFGTGIMYRTDKVDPAVIEEKGWDIFWDPTYKGQMSILDDKREGIALALLRKGITDVNTADKAQIEQAGKDLKELTDTSNIRVTIEGYKDVPEGTITIAQAWSGDPIAGVNSYLPDGTDASAIGWWYPKDRVGVVNNDTMVISKDAESPVLAHLFIDFMLDTENAKLNYGWNGYQPPLTGIDRESVVADELVPESLASAVLTGEDVTKGLRLLYLPPDTEALYNSAWSGFTAGT